MLFRYTCSLSVSFLFQIQLQFLFPSILFALFHYLTHISFFHLYYIYFLYATLSVLQTCHHSHTSAVALTLYALYFTYSNSCSLALVPQLDITLVVRLERIQACSTPLSLLSNILLLQNLANCHNFPCCYTSFPINILYFSHTIFQWLILLQWATKPFQCFALCNKPKKK